VKPGQGKRDHDGGSTDDVEQVTSRVQTRSTQPTAGDNVGSAAARTAGRGRDEVQSLAATRCQRRPSDQLTPSHRPRLDTRERQHVRPSTDNSGRHTVQQRHTLGRQRVSSPVRQLRLILGLTVRHTVRQLRLTTTGLLSFTHSAQLLELNSIYTVSRLLDRLTVY